MHAMPQKSGGTGTAAPKNLEDIMASIQALATSVSNLKLQENTQAQGIRKKCPTGLPMQAYGASPSPTT